VDLDTRISIDSHTAIPLDYDISLLKIVLYQYILNIMQNRKKNTVKFNIYQIVCTRRVYVIAFIIYAQRQNINAN
jgi:hypothetical protein